MVRSFLLYFQGVTNPQQGLLFAIYATLYVFLIHLVLFMEQGSMCLVVQVVPDVGIVVLYALVMA